MTRASGLRDHWERGRGSGFPVSRGELAYRRCTGGRRPESGVTSASPLYLECKCSWLTTSKREPKGLRNLGKRRAAGAPRNASRDERYWESLERVLAGERAAQDQRVHLVSAFVGE